MAVAGIFVSESWRAQSRPVRSDRRDLFRANLVAKNKKTPRTKSDNQSESVGIF
jgi:hypothetical protein